MIRIGPAGIPLSCKGRTLKDGIIYTKSLELDALEVQFVRGIRMTEEDAAEVGEVAQAADVELHVHAPYYTNLAGDERNLELSREKIMKAANLANIMGAESVVAHPGFYGDLTPEEAMARVVKVVGDLRDEFRSNGWKPKLALEMMGKRAVFGSLEEIVQVCQEVEGVLPVVDFAHIHARGNGSLNTVEDFQEVFDKLIPLGLNHYLVHFTGVLYENGNERHHLPIKKGDLRFEPLVEVILENDYNVTLVSTSPILEHDAMYMQIVLDRVKEKREQRLQKETLRLQQEAEKAALDAEKARDEEAARREMEAAEAARKAAEEKAKAAAKPPEPRPQCAAVTQAGDPCRNPAREGSKYCSSHRGWRPSKEQKEILEEKVKKPAKAAPAKAAAKPAAPAKNANGKAAPAKPAAAAKKSAKSSKQTTNAKKAPPKAPAKAAKKSASTKKSASHKSKKEMKPTKSSEGGPGAKPAAKKASKKTPAKKTAAKKAAPKKAAKKTAAKKAPAKKTAAKKSAAAKKATPRKSATKTGAAAKKAPAKKTAAKKTTRRSTSKRTAENAPPSVTAGSNTSRSPKTSSPSPMGAQEDHDRTTTKDEQGFGSRLANAAKRLVSRKK